MKKNTKSEISSKMSFNIITIGDSGVGKTSIIRKYLYNIFDSNVFQTIGLNFSFKEVNIKNGEKVILKLIDTAGQEKYNSLSKSYYKNSDGVLFVFDFNDEESFENIRNWISLFNENHNGKKGIPIYLIGNKSDLEKKVSKESIDELIQETGYEFKELSALNDDEIKFGEVFEEIAEKLYTIEKKYGNREQKGKQISKYDENNNNKKDCVCRFE